MISSDGNHSVGETVLQQDRDSAEVSVKSATPSGAAPFATRSKQSLKPQLSQNKPALIGAGAVALALLVFVFTSAGRHPHAKVQKTTTAAAGHPATDKSAENTDSQKSFFPVTDAGGPIGKETKHERIDEQDVQRTAIRQQSTGQPLKAKVSPGASLGSLPPFDNSQGAWQAPPFQPTIDSNEPSKPEKDNDPPSLVFVQKTTQTNSVKTTDQGSTNIDAGLGLPTGTRLRARLEVAASTAVRTPVIAVVEYNYEKDGEITIPAGAKALGHIEQADRSGYLSIRFDSLLMPDGASTPIEAVATDVSLRPLKGKVEGKNTGKNALVRSLSGIGQVGTLFAGRNGSLNQPFSEGDFIRERLSTNIGETADQEVTKLALTEHVVVSIAANTPIYVVLDHGAKLDVNRATLPGTSAPASQNLESLRQLLQLQRELSQPQETNPRP
jgi:hypothetical protein